MEKFLKLREHGIDVRTEITAGLITLSAMSYVLFVDPSILSQTGMPAQGTSLATTIGAVVGTLMMAFYANLPCAQAPGMGLNAFFIYIVVFSLGYTRQEVLAMAFIYGLISPVIIVTKVRKLIIESIPVTLKSVISAGTSIFLAYVGIKNAGLLKFSVDVGTHTVSGIGVDKGLASITANVPATSGLVVSNTLTVILVLIGLAIIIFFIVKGIRGGVILSVVVTTIAGAFMGTIDLGSINWLTTNLSASINDLKQVFGAAFGSQGLGLLFSDISCIPGVLMATLAFSLTSIFDTIGTLVGTGEKASIVTTTDENKELKSPDRAFYSGLAGTTLGAIAGTLDVTTYVELAAGIGAGGRTGLTALVVAVPFATSGLFGPLVSIAPIQATAPIFIIVGMMMLSNLKNVKWDDLSEVIPAFFTSIFMGFSYDITYGIVAGFITYTSVKIMKGQARDVHFVMWILDFLFIPNLVCLAIL